MAIWAEGLAIFEQAVLTIIHVNAIATALEHLYRHREIVKEMSTAARRRVVENFTWDHFRTRLLDAYETAMRMAR